SDLAQFGDRLAAVAWPAAVVGLAIEALPEFLRGLAELDMGGAVGSHGLRLGSGAAAEDLRAERVADFLRAGIVAPEVARAPADSLHVLAGDAVLVGPAAEGPFREAVEFAGDVAADGRVAERLELGERRPDRMAEEAPHGLHGIRYSARNLH